MITLQCRFIAVARYTLRSGVRLSVRPSVFKVLHLVQASSNVIFLYSCAAVDNISTDVARRAVPLR